MGQAFCLFSSLLSVLWQLYSIELRVCFLASFDPSEQPVESDVTDWIGPECDGGPWPLNMPIWVHISRRLYAFVVMCSRGLVRTRLGGLILTTQAEQLAFHLLPLSCTCDYIHLQRSVDLRWDSKAITEPGDDQVSTSTTRDGKAKPLPAPPNFPPKLGREACPSQPQFGNLGHGPRYQNAMSTTVVSAQIP